MFLFILRHWQIFLVLGALLTVSGGYGLGRWQGHAAGVKSAEDAYTVKYLALLNESRVAIVKTEVEYEKKRKEIAAITGPDPVAGPRVHRAIDSLPEPDRKD